jgi:hypothetical protein
MSCTDPASLGQGKSNYLDAFDRAMIEFAVQWEPYGGPRDEDLFPRFGLTRNRLFARIESIIGLHNVSHFKNEADRKLIVAAVRVLASYRATQLNQDAHPANHAVSSRRKDSLELPPNTEWRYERGVWRCRPKGLT